MNPPASEDARVGENRKSTLKATRQKSGMRENILSVAIELFGSRGYDAVSLRDVTAEVGLKAPALYNHFSSKEELLAEAMLSALAAFNTAVVDADDAGATPLSRLDGMVQRHVLYQIEHSALAKANDRLIESTLVDRIGDHDTKLRLKRMMRGYLDRLTEIVTLVLRESRTDSDLNPRICSLAIAAMCDGVLVWYRPGGSESKQRIAKRYSEMVWNMLGCRRRPDTTT